MERIDDKCLVCGSTAVKQFFEVRGAPIMGNTPFPTRESARNVGRAEMRLEFCQKCGHIFNGAFDSKRTEYNEGYENPLHYSSRFKAYNAELIARLINTYDLHNKKIMDVGGGKGHFLNLLCKEGNNQGICFDPACEVEQAQKSTGPITFIKDFYSEKYRDYKADLICCRHVLEHIYSLRQFLDLIRHAISDKANAFVFFEVPNADYVFKDLSVWDLLYEHCSYFTKNSLHYLFAVSGFRVCNLFETYKDQYLCIEAKPATKSAEIKNYDMEKVIHSVERFGEKYQKKIETWRQKFESLKQANKKAVVWGAGTKGVMFLNMLKIEDQIEYVVDINPNKQGRYIAGAGQKIITPDFLKEYKPDTIVIMNQIYENEIKQILNNLEISAEFLYA
ncbi:MAG: methyltransferase domain-containing protein [Candidatus Omnitrophota bacterium]|nr:MAG: methyltransferase domain-containing protein [Candidatus Omnitrophota bacterium]